MLVKGIIEEIYSDLTQVKVRIPYINKFEDSIGATPKEELYIAPISTTPGCYPALNVGDVVFVDFEQDLLGKPVVVGKLFLNDYDSGKYTLDIKANNIDIQTECNLPQNTTIGYINGNEISQLKGVNHNIQDQIDNINSILKGLTPSGYEELIEKVNTMSSTLQNAISDISKLDTKYNTLYDALHNVIDDISIEDNGKVVAVVDGELNKKDLHLGNVSTLSFDVIEN